MPISRPFAALGLCLVAPLALCATPTGKWTGKLLMNTPPLPANMPPAQKAQVTKMMAGMKAVRIVLDLKANKTYAGTVSGIPGMAGSRKETGTWSQKGNTVVISEKSPGKTVQTLVLSPDGKTMTLAAPNGQGKVVFTR